MTIVVMPVERSKLQHLRSETETLNPRDRDRGVPVQALDYVVVTEVDRNQNVQK
jgi:hypothetical protein